VIPGVVFRYLCLLTAVANMVGNVVLLLFYEPLFSWLGVPLPTDLHAFALEAVLSFTMGVVALLVFMDPQRNLALLKIGIIGKGAYGLITYYFYVVHEVHWFFLVFVVWDAVYVIIFFLYWIQLESSDLLEMEQDVLAGIERKATRRALVIGFSLTGNGTRAMQRLKAGLEGEGYEVDVTHPVPQESIFRFPMSFLDFVRIIVRAFFRRPSRIAPLEVPGTDYDLIVVESQTWLLGMSAPMEAVLQDPANVRLFQGRDAAVLVVCRGAHRRTQAMAVRGLERCGANVVAARGFAHAGWEPRRLMSLWFYLIFRRAGVPPLLAAPHYGLSEASLAAVETYGADLARRERTRGHWTLLLGGDADAD
jgi:hypothetical protein